MFYRNFIWIFNLFFNILNLLLILAPSKRRQDNGYDLGLKNNKWSHSQLYAFWCFSSLGRTEKWFLFPWVSFSWMIPERSQGLFAYYAWAWELLRKPDTYHKHFFWKSECENIYICKLFMLHMSIHWLSS